MADDHLDTEFIERQRQRLGGIRDELLHRTGEMGEIEPEQNQGELDSSDSSAYLFNREVDATVERREKKRLAFVERALEKIDEGTYGVCDDTGEPIQKGRLEAVPEAVYTLEAEQRHEGSG